MGPQTAQKECDMTIVEPGARDAAHRKETVDQPEPHGPAPVRPLPDVPAQESPQAADAADRGAPDVEQAEAAKGAASAGEEAFDIEPDKQEGFEAPGDPAGATSTQDATQKPAIATGPLSQELKARAHACIKGNAKDQTVIVEEAEEPSYLTGFWLRLKITTETFWNSTAGRQNPSGSKLLHHMEEAKADRNAALEAAASDKNVIASIHHRLSDCPEALADGSNLLLIRDEAVSHTHENCDHCGGHGEITCHGCGGRKTLTCTSCSGMGQRVCGSCGGSGQYSNGTSSSYCAGCHGSGRARCGGCHGSGWYNCPTCRGHGSLGCNPCARTGVITYVFGYTVTANRRLRTGFQKDAPAFFREAVRAWAKSGLSGASGSHLEFAFDPPVRDGEGYLVKVHTRIACAMMAGVAAGAEFLATSVDIPSRLIMFSPFLDKLLAGEREDLRKLSDDNARPAAVFASARKTRAGAAIAEAIRTKKKPEDVLHAIEREYDGALSLETLYHMAQSLKNVKQSFTKAAATWPWRIAVLLSALPLGLLALADPATELMARLQGLGLALAIVPALAIVAVIGLGAGAVSRIRLKKELGRGTVMPPKTRTGLKWMAVMLVLAALAVGAPLHPEFGKQFKAVAVDMRAKAGVAEGDVKVFYDDIWRLAYGMTRGSTLRIVPHVKRPPTPDGTVYIGRGVINGGANIRARPTTSAPVIATAVRGDVFNIISERADASGRLWYEIQLGDRRAWVAKSLFMPRLIVF
jgi:hypothetical protein